MATFPTLKTGAVMQYPATRTVQYSNQILRFVDGREQRYREFPSTLHSWVIRLDLLDESEMKTLENFFIAQQGEFGSFEFVDPNDNTSYPDCSLQIDDLDFTLNGERRSQTSVVVRENRN